MADQRSSSPPARRLVLCAALMPLLLPSPSAAAPPQVTPAELSQTVQTIAGPAFQGRAPGTAGETRTVAYLIDRLQRLGLEPGGPGGRWTQSVPLIHNVIGQASTISVASGTQHIPLVIGTDIALLVNGQVDHLQIQNAPLIFVGYGVHAPERGWDDFKGVDLHGKVAVFLVNDPDFEAQPGDDAYGRFDGPAMTYYGRWSYKYEEAARRGAVGAIVIHETGPAGYGWNVAGNMAGGSYALPDGSGEPRPMGLSARLSHEAALTLFRASGLDLGALKKQARSAAFHPVAMGAMQFSADLTVRSERIESQNVLARLPGTGHRDETIVLAAHWDAFGEGKPDAQGRTIRPGANDDGLGVAGILALAAAFRKHPAPARSLVFAFWTAEERGLLGSEFYARNPVYPLDKTVASLTIDILQTAGPARDVVQIGGGQSSLDEDLKQAAAEQGRTVTPDSKPERGLFYRADHFSFAKRGVPTLLLMGAGGGADLVKGGRAAGDAWVEDYTSHCYHAPCDAWSADWDLRGAAADVNVFYTIADRLARSRAWPVLSPTSEFKPARAVSDGR